MSPIGRLNTCLRVLCLGVLVGCDGPAPSIENRQRNSVFDAIAQGDLGTDDPLDAMVGAVPPDDSITDLGRVMIDAFKPHRPCSGGSVSSTGEARLGVSGCEIRRNGSPSGVLRGVVVSADSLTTPLSTSAHTESDFQSLKERGLDYVWLLVPLKGLMPIEETFDAAFMGRVCTQADGIRLAGLDLLVGVYGDTRTGRTEDGGPAWVNDLSPDPFVRSDLFWERHSHHLTEAWRRLLDTCGDVLSISGAQPLVSPSIGLNETSLAIIRMRFEAIFDLIEERQGPVMRLVEKVIGPSEDHIYWADIWSDTVYMPSALLDQRERGAGLTAERLATLKNQANELGLPLWIRAVAGTTVEALEGQLDVLDAQGVMGALWHDGISGDFALRRPDWSLKDTFEAVLERPLVRSYQGEGLSVIANREQTTFEWFARGSQVELFEFEPGWHGSDCSVELDAESTTDVSYAYDPIKRSVTVVLVAGEGRRKLTVTSGP